MRSGTSISGKPAGKVDTARGKGRTASGAWHKAGAGHKFTVYLLSVTLLLLCLLSGCGSKVPEVDGEKKTEADKIRIGLCFDSFVIERWEKDRDVFVSTARELGAEVNVQNANGELSEQISQIEYFIQKDVDAIVIISIDGNALGDVVKKAKSKGIKVIAYDRMLNNCDADLYVSFDNEMVGTLMAEALVASELANNKVLMLQGSPTDNNVDQVRKGFDPVISRNAVSVIGSMYADGWRAEDASEYLEAHSELLEETDGIMCGNDNIATQVARVLAENRKLGKIALVGQDADLEACQRIVEGTQAMTVYKPVEKEAEAAARGTVALIKGEEIEGAVYVSDGSYSIPGIMLDPIAVTRDNIDETIIESGFHLQEEVYLNVKSEP